MVYPKGEKPRIKANWHPYIKTSIFGSIDNDGKLTAINEDKANSETFCKFLDEVVKQNSEYQVFVMFVDRSPYHRSKNVREHIYKLRGLGYNFKLIWLPRYSPDLNPIEQKWKLLKNEIRNRIINTKQELKLTVINEITTLSMNSSGALSNYFPELFR